MPLTDNTAQWGVRRLTKFQDNNGIPVGFEYFSTNPNVPVGSLPLFGGEYSRTVYADLWSWVQEQAGYLIEESEWQAKSVANDGNVPFYSKGDGTTTFRVPSLKCWVKGANGIEEVGSYLSAGLPNITGGFRAYSYVNGSGYGALSSQVNNPNVLPAGSADSMNYVDYYFDAQGSSDIYGNSDTVQPKSIVGMWLVKAYGTVTNVGNIDIADIGQGLAELENRLSTYVKRVNGANADANGDVTITTGAPIEYDYSQFLNGTSYPTGYELYSNGKFVCFGYSRGSVTFPMPMDKVFCIKVTQNTPMNYHRPARTGGTTAVNVTNTGFSIQIGSLSDESHNGVATTSGDAYWEAIGFISQGDDNA